MSILGELRLRLEGFVVDRFLSYDAATLADALRVLGIARADVLMVHASLRPHCGFRGRPADMIRTLQDLVTPSGLLVMPSMTYMDSSKTYLQRGEVMNVRRSASKMGLLSEVFRRGKDVRRSLNPTHPLLAWGSRADEFIAGHELTEFSFGSCSPFRRLLDLDGKILCIDAAPGTITFTHHLEDKHADRLAFNLYDRELYTGNVVNAAGEVLTVDTRVLSDESRSRRNEDALWFQAGKSGALRTKRLGNTKLTLIGCRTLDQLVEQIYQGGETLFGG